MRRVGMFLLMVAAAYVTAGSNCSRPQTPPRTGSTGGGGDGTTIPDVGQVPVDFKSALWVELILVEVGIAGYLLAVGSKVPRHTITTQKGDVEVEPSSEHWFATIEDMQGVVENATTLRWRVEEVADIIETQTLDDELVPLIDKAEALGDLSPVAIGPSGAVVWGNLSVLPKNLATFGYQAGPSKPEWHLSLKHGRAPLSEIIWSTSQGSGNHALPDEFGHAGDIDLAITTTPTVKAAFTDYLYP